MTRFLEDFSPQEVAALEAQYRAKVKKILEVGWFNRHFYDYDGTYYCNYCNWESQINSRTKNFQRGLQKVFLSRAKRHLEQHKE